MGARLGSWIESRLLTMFAFPLLASSVQPLESSLRHLPPKVLGSSTTSTRLRRSGKDLMSISTTSTGRPPASASFSRPRTTRRRSGRTMSWSLQRAEARASSRRTASTYCPSELMAPNIPGLRGTVGYVSLDDYGPEALAVLIDEKLVPRQRAEFLPPVLDRLYEAVGVEDAAVVITSMCTQTTSSRASSV